jgi:hypothetical protein
LRELARSVDGEKVGAIFRLEPQDPATLRRVASEFDMDVLLVSSSEGVYSVFELRTETFEPIEPGDVDRQLKGRYGLTIRGIEAPWLERVKRRYLATRLLSEELVEVMLILPRQASEVITGRIRADCDALGYSLDELEACYGTFVELPLAGGARFDYRVTRVLLRDGTEVPGVVE